MSKSEVKRGRRTEGNGNIEHSTSNIELPSEERNTNSEVGMSGIGSTACGFAKRLGTDETLA
jgi:hypothetical protein